ncbi:MAG: hypothetical protein GY927_24380, partial [bacterium]|nr:hypothetical protein [bacterium]
MANQNGMAYAQNYDVIIKWLAEALRGETLDVLGVPTGRIEEVFGFEPVEIAVKAERVDVMLRDETGAFYHLEEQRNLRRTDLYRFASYHFMAARQWGVHLTDVILASGEVYAGEKVITTQSGTYAPLVIDFTQRDGRRRLTEIRDAVQAGTFEHWFELVFLPLYGKETGEARSAFVEEVLHFEVDLYKARKLSARLVAATMILSNKLITTERLEALWEEVKMLDILEIARKKGIEEGIQEGKTLGLQEGKTLGLQEGKTLGLQEGKTLGLQEGKTLGLQEGKTLGQ